MKQYLPHCQGNLLNFIRSKTELSNFHVRRNYVQKVEEQENVKLIWILLSSRIEMGQKKKKEQNWVRRLGRVGRDLSISLMQKLLLRIPIKWLGRFGLWKERNGLFHSLSYPIFPRALPYLVMSLSSLPVTERAKTKKLMAFVAR